MEDKQIRNHIDTAACNCFIIKMAKGSGILSSNAAINKTLSRMALIHKGNTGYYLCLIDKNNVLGIIITELSRCKQQSLPGPLYQSKCHYRVGLFLTYGSVVGKVK